MRSFPVLGCLATVLAFAPPSPAAEAVAPKRFEPGLVSTGFDDAHVSFSPDGQMLYFLRSSPDFAHWTVLVSRRAGQRWGPAEVAPFSGRWNDGDVTITRDGRRLFFISNRPVEGDTPRPDTEIWTMERTGSGWGPPRHVAELSSPGDEWFPTMTDDGTLFFGSERPGGTGKCDLWQARWQGDHFAPPENLGEPINTKDQEIEPWISADGKMLIFAGTGRSQGQGAYDLFVTFRCGARWTDPRPLGAGVNSTGWDFGPRFSPDGKTFFWTSNRSTWPPSHPRALTAKELESVLGSPGNGLRDVYQVPASALDLRSPCAETR
jgi:Tol biopolymer transport system component